MPNKYAGDLRIKFFLGDEAKELLEKRPGYIPYSQGRASGYGHECKRIVLEGLGLTYVDLHEQQIQAAQDRQRDLAAAKASKAADKIKAAVAKTPVSPAEGLKDKLSKLKNKAASKKKTSIKAKAKAKARK